MSRSKQPLSALRNNVKKRGFSRKSIGGSTTRSLRSSGNAKLLQQGSAWSEGKGNAKEGFREPAMGLKDGLEQEYKAALKAGDKLKVSTLRMLKSALHNKEIEEGHGLSTQEEFRVIQMLLKQREEAIEAYRSGGRHDLADKEAQEMKILEVYLPQQLSEEQLESLVRAVLQEHGATSLKEAQPLTRVVLERAEGRAEGKRVQQVLRRMFP